MTSAARTLSSMVACASPAARAVRIAVMAAVSSVAAVAGWRSASAAHHGVIDDHTLRDLGIHRLDIG